MKKICLLSHLHLSTNPRLWKEAFSLKKAGYDVVILTIWTSAKKLQEDRLLLGDSEIEYNGVINLIPGENSSTAIILTKVKKKIALYFRKFLSVEGGWLLGAEPGTFLKTASKQQADLYIAHAEFGFFIGRLLVRQGKKVAFDFEDWYSRDYLLKTRPVKLLESLEKFALENGEWCSCPSTSMANAIKETYKIERAIEVIYNGFSIEENRAYNNEPLNVKPLSLVWFSQKIGPGRGLENLLKAITFLQHRIELHLIGIIDGAYQAKLTNSFPVDDGHQLFFHPPVLHKQLMKILPQFKIGLALEEQYPESRNVTITNKILQYLQASIKVLATSTKGQAEVAKQFPGSVKIVSFKNPAEWAAALDTLLTIEDMSSLPQFSTFQQHFSWEAQEKRLLSLTANTFMA